MESLRDLAGHVGRVLIQHGFEDAGAGSDWVPIAQGHGLVSFRGSMGISETMRETMLRMAGLHNDLRRTVEQTGKARETEALTEVLRLWDRA